MATQSQRIDALESKLDQLLTVMLQQNEQRTATVPTIAAPQVQPMAAPQVAAPVATVDMTAEQLEAAKIAAIKATLEFQAWKSRCSEYSQMRTAEYQTNGKTQDYINLTVEYRLWIIAGRDAGFPLTDNQRQNVKKWKNYKTNVMPLPKGSTADSRDTRPQLPRVNFVPPVATVVSAPAIATAPVSTATATAPTNVIADGNTIGAFKCDHCAKTFVTQKRLNAHKNGVRLSATSPNAKKTSNPAADAAADMVASGIPMTREMALQSMSPEARKVLGL